MLSLEELEKTLDKVLLHQRDLEVKINNAVKIFNVAMKEFGKKLSKINNEHGGKLKWKKQHKK